MDGGGPFGQQFLQGFYGSNNLRDYTHASKTFLTNSFELKPRFKFLFHVNFVLNIDQIPGLRNAGIFQQQEITNLSLAVKTVDLPKYSIDTEVMNQYNRKRLVQTKINYDPINITFHDDGGDNIREMWYQYYSYYYKDPSYKLNKVPDTNGSIGFLQQRQTGFGYQPRDIYQQQRTGNVNDWGYIGESYGDVTSTTSGKPAFFKQIEIYGFDQHKYAVYVLFNPLITNYNHDTYDYSQGNGTMQNTMTIRYETVKYLSGALSGSYPDVNIGTFPDPAHYDLVKSAIAREGSTATVFGQGGLLETADGILADLESNSVMGILGAVQKAGASYNTWKGKDIKSIATSESVKLGTNVLINNLPGATRAVVNKADGIFFPKANP